MYALREKDQELAWHDYALRGLPLLLDTEQLLRKLGEHMDTSALRDFRLTYIRYKPGMNFLGRYEYRLDGETHWAYGKAFAADAALKLAKSAEVPHIKGPLGPGRLQLPESDLFMSFFPNDLGLRSITRLADPADRDSLLRRIFHGSDAWDGSRQTILNYKPERRLVLRLVNSSQQAATVKFYTGREFSRISHQRRPQSGHQALPLLKRIGDSRKHRAFAFDWIEGETLRARSRNSVDATACFRATGLLIARYHASSVKGLLPEEMSSQLQVLESMAEQLAYLLPGSGDAALDLAAGLRSIAATKSVELCPVHGDFYDKQIIVGPGGLSLIDLDRAHLGTANEDLGCFLAHQELLAIRTQAKDRERISSQSAAFLDGYQEAGGHIDKQQLAGWTALFLFRLSHNPFRDRSLDWPRQTVQVLRRASELLRASREQANLTARIR